MSDVSQLRHRETPPGAALPVEVDLSPGEVVRAT
jgi:hypothetical protein